jgi:hypothetical protein
MSCVLALAFPTVGLVCADTRLNLTSDTGVPGYNDDSPLTVHLDDGSAVEFGPAGRKIRRYEWGWLAGGGSTGLAHHLCLDGLSTRKINSMDLVERYYLEEFNRHAPVVRSQLFDKTSPDRAAVAYVFNTPSNLKVAALDTDNPQPPAQTNAFRLIPPAGFTAAQTTTAERLLTADLHPPKNKNAIADMVLAVSRMFRYVHENSSSVSDIIELGVLTRHGLNEWGGYSLLQSNETLLNGGRRTVLQCLEPL